MDFRFDEGMTAVSDLARKLFSERLTPAALKAVEAEEDRFARKLWGELAQVGLLGTAIPEVYGGGGQGFLALCALLEEAGAHVAPLPLWPALVLGALPVAEYGTLAQKKAFLPGIASGEIILTAALVESASRDPREPETVAVRDGSDFRLTGEKTCVAAAHLAKNILVTARTKGDEVGLFLVDPKGEGVHLERQIATTGEPQGQLVLSGAKVREEDVLGSPATGRGILDWLLPRATVALCAMELGVTKSVLKTTAAYTSQRQQFDRPIATFQAVAQRAADAYIDVEAIRVSTWQAAWRLAEGLPAAKEVAIAKYFAAEAGHRVVYAAQHLHGGMGYDVDYPLYRYYLLSKLVELTLGGAAVQLAALGDEMKGAAFYEA